MEIHSTQVNWNIFLFQSLNDPPIGWPTHELRHLMKCDNHPHAFTTLFFRLLNAFYAQDGSSYGMVSFPTPLPSLIVSDNTFHKLVMIWYAIIVAGYVTFILMDFLS